jgi:glycosyltransferase involved in cell wall biosynthesis
MVENPPMDDGCTAAAMAGPAAAALPPGVSISVIVPTYNAAATLALCLDSLSAQTERRFEVLVIDGGSSDDSVEIARRHLAVHPHVQIVSEPDRGIYDAINKGIRRARGEWLYVLGSDDALHDSSVIAGVMRRLGPQADLYYGKVYRRSIAAVVGRPMAAHDLHSGNICQQAIFYRRCLFERHGGFSLDYPLCADWAFNIVCFAQKRPPVFIDMMVARYAGDGRSAMTVDERFYTDRLRLIADAYRAPYTAAVFSAARYLFLEDARAQWARRERAKALRSALLFAYHSALLRLRRRGLVMRA